MENPEHLNFEIHKLINNLYKMRFFITAPILQPENFNDWLFLRNKNQQLINDKHLSTLSQFSQSFTALFKDQMHINSFIEKLLGEEVGKNSFHSGLMQNKPQGLYYFFTIPANYAIKDFLLDNLAKLNEAYSDWQDYQDKHVQLNRLINECTKEIEKKYLRNETLKLWHTVTKNIQHTINKAKLPAKIKTIPQAPIHLTDPDDFPILHQLIRIINSTPTASLLNHVTDLIKLRLSFNASMETNFLDHIMKIDRCIFECLFHDLTNINEKLINHYSINLYNHLVPQLQPYSPFTAHDPKARDATLTAYLTYAQKILDLSRIYLQRYYSFSLANFNNNLIRLLSEIKQQSILENDSIVDADDDNDIPSTQKTDASQPADDDFLHGPDDLLTTSSSVENEMHSLVVLVIPEKENLVPSTTQPYQEKSEQRSFKRSHSSEQLAETAATENHEKQLSKKSRVILQDINSRPMIGVGSRRLHSDLPEQFALSLARRGLFPAPAVKRCKSLSVIKENDTTPLPQFV